MSRYPSDFRGPRDRSRSPPRFPDRRPSAPSIYDGRPPGLTRNATDVHRGPRSGLDGSRPSLPNSLSSTGSARPYNSLRDAPPLGAGDRARSYRERDTYDRRERLPSPRERSPPRGFKDSRDLPPRDLDTNRARRPSIDAPPSAGSPFPESQSYTPGLPRGTPARGRGRGDLSTRAARGGRGGFDDRERDLLRRDRSPPPRWGRDVSRDARDRDTERDRKERFLERDGRRPMDWFDREREVERPRRDLPPRAEGRPTNDSPAGGSGTSQSSQPLPINPARLALIESTGADASVRRPSVQSDVSLQREVKREQPEPPAYINGRAATRFGSRGSSPPAQAPAVPAFTLSFAPPTASPSQPPIATGSTGPSPLKRLSSEMKPNPSPPKEKQGESPKAAPQPKPEAPAEAPIAPRAPPPAPRAQLAAPPITAPRAPRAYDNDEQTTASHRLQGVRSLETLQGPNAPPVGPASARSESFARPLTASTSPSVSQVLPNLVQPVSPMVARPELQAPTGPRASRVSPALPSISPHPRATSPPMSVAPAQTPPPSAPLGPRNKSFSVSPKAATTAAPTAPRAERAPPLAPRALERAPIAPGRRIERPVAAPAWAPPSAPRGSQWNHWIRGGPLAPGFGDKSIPAKRDAQGGEKARSGDHNPADQSFGPSAKSEDLSSTRAVVAGDAGRQAPRKQGSLSGHSAAQSFFGRPNVADEDDEDEDDGDEDTGMSDAVREEPLSTSDEDDSDLDEDLTLFNAKFERQKRQLEAQKVDLSSRHVRATTPLESIARLARISTKDLQRVNEQRANEMDLDGPAGAHNHALQPHTARSSDSGEGPDLLTPKGEDDARVTVRGSDDSATSIIRRIRRVTPEPVALPYLLKEGQPHFGESETFQQSIEQYDDSKIDIKYELHKDFAAEDDAEQDLETAFKSEYRKWREECENLDREREERERLERQQSLEPGPEPDVPVTTPANPVVEGRRMHKFSSEYEIEQVIKQSEETARIEQERQDREARKNQADMEKEAILPDQIPEHEVWRTLLIDRNTYREPESLTLVFSYEPPADTFTEQEQTIFTAAFKETPKKWGEIASLLPGRTYRDCIHHYYANKWSGRFRDNRTKKMKGGGRRGRGGRSGGRGRTGGLMADLRVGSEDAATQEIMSDKGRPRRAAAPTTFGEKEVDSKASLLGPSPAKKGSSKGDGNADAGSEKPNKRPKRTGEKPGRKAKATQPLAALAAAPQASSPGKPLVPGPQTKEEINGPNLEEARLLAGFHGGRTGVSSVDARMLYTQEGYPHPVLPLVEDKPAMQVQAQAQAQAQTQAPAAPAKQGASSYWSVPEQQDFLKYIKHFGRDFGAIAAHMGTKTQTMIKNHYQRQVDGGNHPEIEAVAVAADERRKRGEDIGPPPTPTPIQKRKYDGPQSTSQRPLAPHTDAMEIDDTRVPVTKHASPPQYQQQPRFASSAQSTPLQTARNLLQTAASPGSTSSIPGPRPLQHALGFLSDSRMDSRGGAPPSAFRSSLENPASQPPQQPGRNTSDTPDPSYLRNLAVQQERALRVQAQSQSLVGALPNDRLDTLHRAPAIQRNLSQGSPIQHAPLHEPADIKPISDDRERGISHASPRFSSTSIFPRPFVTLGNTPAFAPRIPPNSSPPKRDDVRPSSTIGAGSLLGSSQPPPPAQPAERKRVNVMSLLNSEPVEEKAKPESQRTTSADMFASAPRRDLSFTSSLAASSFGRSRFEGHQSTASTPAPPALKTELSGSGSSLSQPKPDWAQSVLQQSAAATASAPSSIDRDVRGFSHYRASPLSSLGGRAVPSPPPPAGLAHSRTSSLNGPAREQPKEPARGSLLAPTQGVYQSYNGQLAPFSSSATPTPSQHHPSAPSLSNPHTPYSLHHRGISRDNDAPLRSDQALALQREPDFARESRHVRLPQDDRWQRLTLDESRRRDEQLFYTQQQQQQQQQRHREQEEDRQHHVVRRQPDLQQRPSPFATNSTFAASPATPRPLDLRGQSRLEAEMAVRGEQEREAESRRRHQQQQQQQLDAVSRRDREQVDFRRRQQQMQQQQQQQMDETSSSSSSGLFARRTPLGGGVGFGAPGSQQQQQQQGQRR